MTDVITEGVQGPEGIQGDPWIVGEDGRLSFPFISNDYGSFFFIGSPSQIILFHHLWPATMTPEFVVVDSAHSGPALTFSVGIYDKDLNKLTAGDAQVSTLGAQLIAFDTPLVQVPAGMVTIAISSNWSGVGLLGPAVASDQNDFLNELTLIPKVCVANETSASGILPATVTRGAPLQLTRWPCLNFLALELIGPA